MNYGKQNLHSHICCWTFSLQIENKKCYTTYTAILLCSDNFEFFKFTSRYFIFFPSDFPMDLFKRARSFWGVGAEIDSSDIGKAKISMFIWNLWDASSLQEGKKVLCESVRVWTTFSTRPCNLQHENISKTNISCRFVSTYEFRVLDFSTDANKTKDSITADVWKKREHLM